MHFIFITVKFVLNISDDIDLSELQKDWLENEGASHICNVAEHYNVFKDLFDHGVFTPCVPLDIIYSLDENSGNPVHMGNILQASDVSYNF